MRLIRRTEQIIEGEPAEIAALHRDSGYATLAEPEHRPARAAPTVSALLYGCTSIVCRHRMVAVEPVDGQTCPACRNGSLRFDDYCTAVLGGRSVGR